MQAPHHFSEIDFLSVCGTKHAFLGCIQTEASYDGCMKNALTLLASVLTMAHATAQTVAVDARTEHLLAKAHQTAHAATRTYAAQPNGTTHAMADVAYCAFSEKISFARLHSFSVTSVELQLEGLTTHRARLKLPVIDCARPSTPLKL